MFSKIGSNSIAFGIKPEELEMGKKYKHTNGCNYSLEEPPKKEGSYMSVSLISWDILDAVDKYNKVSKTPTMSIKGTFETGKELGFLV